MKKLIKRYKWWREWSSRYDGKFSYKLAVLFNLASSPSFVLFKHKKMTEEIDWSIWREDNVKD